MIRCLEKNYWADSECALNAVATAVILTLDHVSPPVSPFICFSPLSLRHGVVVVCFEVPGWTLCLNGCSLWSLGSWLGGSPVSALSFVASITLLHGPFVLFRVVFVLLHFRWPYSRWHTRCHRASYFSELVAIPLLCALWVWFCCGFVCFLFVCLVCGLGFDGTAHWTVYKSITSALLRLSMFRRPCMIIYNSSFCCGWTCVTTWRKPWRRWTEKKGAETRDPPSQDPRDHMAEAVKA